MPTFSNNDEFQTWIAQCNREGIEAYVLELAWPDRARIHSVSYEHVKKMNLNKHRKFGGTYAEIQQYVLQENLGVCECKHCRKKVPRTLVTLVGRCEDS